MSNTDENTQNMVIALVAIHGIFDGLRSLALSENRPTSITMGLEWLRDDTLKVIADLDPKFIPALEE